MPKGSGKQRKRPVPKDLERTTYSVVEVPVEQFAPGYYDRVNEADPGLAAFLSRYTPEDLAQWDPHAYNVVVDGVVVGGFAVLDSHDGGKELIAVHKLPGANVVHLGPILAKESVARGATNLFAFDTEVLRGAYEAAGFKVYQTAPWSEEAAADNPGWDAKRFGKPPVMWMKTVSGVKHPDWWVN